MITYYRFSSYLHIFPVVPNLKVIYFSLDFTNESIRTWVWNFFLTPLNVKIDWKMATGFNIALFKQVIQPDFYWHLFL
jgi:hypothetical protein